MCSSPFFLLPCVKVHLLLCATKNSTSLHSWLCHGCYLCLHLLFDLYTLLAIQSQHDTCFLLLVGFFSLTLSPSVNMHCAVFNHLVNIRKLRFFRMFIVRKGWMSSVLVWKYLLHLWCALRLSLTNTLTVSSALESCLDSAKFSLVDFCEGFFM